MLDGPIEAAGPVKGFQKSFEVAQQQRSKSVQERLDGYSNNLAIALEAPSDARLVEYQDRLGGKQRADYSLGKCSYRNRELRDRQLDDQELEHECDKKENEYRAGRDELAM